MGVGNSGEKDPIAAVRGAEGGSWKAVPVAVIPERGQRTEYLSEAFSVVETEEVCNVLHEHVSRSKVANGPEHLSPKRSLGMAEAVTRAGTRESLARKPAGDDSDWLSPSVNCSDVGVNGDSGEPLPEDSLPELVFLAEPAVLKAGEVESVGEQAASVEKAADRECFASVRIHASVLTTSEDEPGRAFLEAAERPGVPPATITATPR